MEENDEISRDFEEIKINFDKYDQLYKRAVDDVNRLTDANKVIEAENEEFKNRLNKALKINEELLSENSILKDSNDKLLIDSQNENARIRKEYNELEDKYNNLSNKFDSLKSRKRHDDYLSQKYKNFILKRD